LAGRQFEIISTEWPANSMRERKRVDLRSRFGGRDDPYYFALCQESRVLDYGAGTGLLTLKLQPYVKSIVAVDTSPNMLGGFKREVIERARLAILKRCFGMWRPARIYRSIRKSNKPTQFQWFCIISPARKMP
jgi:SAM-dependent methyltransferase